MRDASADLRSVLDGGAFDKAWVADLMYDGSRRLANVPIREPRFSWDGSSQIQGSGSCQVVWGDDFGSSIVPRQIGDVFSPFGAELQVDLIISAGAFSERIPMGRFMFDSVPEATEYAVPGPAGGLPVVTESRVSLELKDYFLRMQRDRYAYPSAVGSTSMWGEAFALTGLPVLRNIDDATLPGSVTYDGDKLQSLGTIFAVADAWPHLTPSGQITARPKTWPAPVGEIRGRVSASRVMESDKVYNRVDVEGKDPAGNVLRAYAEITDGFLRTRNRDGSRSPMGTVSYQYQSDFLTTQAQCQSTADVMLPRVSKLRSVTREVIEPLMPLREVGDVLWLRAASELDADELVRIKSVTHAAATTTSVVEVAE